MKTLFTILGLAALLCGCRTEREENTGGTSERYDNNSGLSQTNNSTQGSGSQKLTNPNSSQPSNP